ncbi:hypothetical protein PABG_12632 [Paracoccidioides brasiliensis Pb03]|nr:hypothetical protein PABG_12632 [Paracoccidioides brasiliensis Pb03]
MKEIHSQLNPLKEVKKAAQVANSSVNSVRANPEDAVAIE